MNRHSPAFWAVLFAALAFSGAGFLFFDYLSRGAPLVWHTALLFLLGMVGAALLAHAGYRLSMARLLRSSAQRGQFYHLSHFSNTFLYEYRLHPCVLTFSNNLPKELKLDVQLEGCNCFAQLRALVHPDDLCKLRDLKDNPPPPNQEVSLELRFLHTQGGYTWYESRTVTTFDKHNRPVTLLGRFENIDSRKRREASLISRSTRDDLTGLLNRSAVALRVEEWTQSPQAKEGGALFMLDLDDFKSINDTLGHTLGDKALLLTAHTLREAFRDSDILGRAGGDEFLVFLSGTNSLELLSSRAEALCQALCRHSNESAIGFPITCSVGISLYPQDGNSYATLFEAADAAMYQAKRDGKNAYHLCSNLNTP